MINRLKKIFVITGFAVMPVLFIFASLFVGRYSITVLDVLKSLVNGLGIGDFELTREISTVVIQLRLPRAIAGACIGAGLAASGTAFQGVFRNPLVNSGLLGVSSGAGFGAALAIVIFGGYTYVYGFAFSFGILAVILSYWIARVYNTVPLVMLILGGTIVSSIFSALLTLLKYVADLNSELPAIVYWLMGSIASVSYKDFWALIPIGLGILVLLFYGWKINVISLGDKEAKSMGIDVGKSKVMIIVAATLATAGAVCMSGVIGWVGLVIPHIGRMIVGNDNRKLLPVSMSIGASFMVLIDSISRSISTSEIPLGVLTALIGAPFFIFLLKKTKGGGWKA